MKHSSILRALAALLLLLSPLSAAAQRADFRVVPLPREVRATQGGSFTLNERTLIACPAGDKELRRTAEMLAEYVEEATGLKLKITTQPVQRHCIRLARALRHPNAEAYALRVNSDIVLIDGASAAGTFYGVQTLRKALPVGPTQEVSLPAVEVADHPRFGYRGAHLDVARHFMTADSVRRFIDLLALHNINRFHWHLTDDQGWRIEMKKYPRLTEVGAWRPSTVIGHNSGRYDGKRHGGFYTRKEIKAIVKYAADRHITIIPEVDMPGHTQAALAAYPELGCTGGPYGVWRDWGVTDTVLCAGRAETYAFIDNVLRELTELFPSDYIHVGGDECPKRAWQACARCQAFIRENGLQADGRHSAEERLQSHLIRHAGETLRRLGRRMIGWDETLEGGLAPGATVMSWRGEGGGIEAARMGHPVIMTPNTYLYFDYCQSTDYAKEPCGAGGYLPIERVYGYEPMPRSLTAEEQAYIIGVQANCWTEYIRNFRDVEYMELPRMAALSEVQWTAPELKDYADFVPRLLRLIDLYRRKEYNFAKTLFGVQLSVTPDTLHRALTATLSTVDGATVRYSLDGSDPARSGQPYSEPLRLREDCELRAVAVRPWGTTAEAAEHLSFNKATACPVRLLHPAHPSYTYGGAALLTDGLRAADTNYASGRWIGFAGNDLEAVIDLGTPTAVSRVEVRTCVEKGAWIFDARRFSVEGSADGQTFTPLAAEDYPPMREADPNRIYDHALRFAPATVRYVKVRLQPEASIPDWHPGKGRPGFVFVDEIAVY